ncbi:MAG: DUF1549 and DUF1553 domain-containing protein [Roseibacillus sp.]|nr:DUF1549 and DUF1553 domain-containing protein [Roseibacillus sp.]
MPIRSGAIASFLLFAAGPFPVHAEKAIDWEEARQFWSFQPPRSVPLPEVQRQSWPQKDLDRFILRKLEDAGLEPEAEAERRTLIRRLSFDLTGLPPAVEEVEEFLASKDPRSYEKLVDRLLARPQFGERLASMWLPVMRYAEDQAHQVGNNSKFFYPHAHQYRRWVIEAFNRDLPFDQFVRLQLAADHYGDEDLAALGFIGLGPQYYNRKRLDVQAEEWEDRVDTVTRSFLGLTVACARCHDHFYDPITTKDYHAMAGIFASVSMDSRKVGDRTFHVVKDSKVQDLNVFIRGNVEEKGELVPRGFLRILASGQERQTFGEGSGRRELAEAIVAPGNPLTSRVMVNRLWGELFGVPLVKSASNFGSTGDRPSHPGLLDYLAIKFREEGWSIKALVRELVLSATYRQASTRRKDNTLLAGMNRRRLSAEMLRDAMLAASGELESADPGGVSLKVSDKKNLRRTVYARISRKELDSFLRQFDYPDANVHAAGRVVTTTPMQKLYLLNSPFVADRAARLSELDKDLEGEERIQSLFRKVLARNPSASELVGSLRYFEESASNRDWAGFAQVLLCSNAFLYRD